MVVCLRGVEAVKAESNILAIKISEYDQEIAQPHTADRPTTP